MSNPINHHYIPVFYLSRWVGADGRVCRFSRPYGVEVKAARVVPKATGFEPRLYETSGLPPEQAQTMEKDFMAKLDARASDALGHLEQGLSEEKWTSRPRSSWSRFMLTQMLRTPEDIAQLKSSVRQTWDEAIPGLQEVYAARRSATDPLTVREYLEGQNIGQVDEFAFSVARTLMDHSKIGQLLNNMHWLVLDIPDDELPLLTSDRPIWMTSTFTEEDAFITMPIGPRKLFTAVISPTTQHKIKARPPRDLVKAVNKIIVQHAVKYVYGLTDAMLPFIQEHMSTKRHSTLLERQAAMRGHEIVARNSPARGQK